MPMAWLLVGVVVAVGMSTSSPSPTVLGQDADLSDRHIPSNAYPALELEAQGLIPQPIGYGGIQGKSVPKYSQKHVRPQNHRFLSYAQVLKSFP